ncbi:hypothetical protein DITRI_Ditri16bG0032100 [Diplodiscus trichospermus]
MPMSPTIFNSRKCFKYNSRSPYISTKVGCICFNSLIPQRLCIMASFRANAYCVLLLVLIICQEICMHYVEGRHLRSKSCKKCSRQRHHNTLKIPNNVNNSFVSGQVQTSKVDDIDDFRHTAPGHSPGVGH